MAAKMKDPGLHGRRAECGMLVKLVDGVRGGDGATLVLSGEPGTGKTTLLEFAAGLARDLQVIHTAGTESETELAYAGLHRLCGPMLGLISRLPGPQREALETAFGVRAGPKPDRFLVGLAVFGLLTDSAARCPLVCVIDDVQWLDPASRQVLTFAARRLAAEPILMIFTVPNPMAELDGLPTTTLSGLRDADARDLVASVLRGPLDERVRDQLVAETRGIPGTLSGLLRRLSPARLAGGFGLLDVLPGDAPGALLAELGELPSPTRQLLLIAAADPTGDPALVWRAAGRLTISNQAAVPAVEARLIRFDRLVVFRDPTVRSAVYSTARLRDRRAAHQALALVTPARTDPDRRAWHQAQALTEADEEVAAELERSAGRAQARGGLAAAAAFLERAAMASPDAGRQARRALAAATMMLQAGEPFAAAKLLDAAEAGPLDQHGQARTDFVRARLTFALNHGSDAPQPLLQAAQQLSRFDAAQARAAHLDAIRAALVAAGRAAPGGTITDVTRSARETAGGDVSGPADVLLVGLVAGLSQEFTAGAPLLRRAVHGFGPELTAAAELDLAPLACTGAFLLWDDRAGETLADRYAGLARSTGALGELPSALNALAIVRLLAGDLPAADSLVREAEATAETVSSPATQYGALGLAAIRGRKDPALALIGRSGQDAARRGEGLGIAAAGWATAVLYNGLGRYADALAAAEEAVDAAGPPVLAGWPMAELIEAAARTGQTDRASVVLRTLSHLTLAAGTDWALGVRARSLALVTGREDLYQAAIEHLARSRARVDLARAHLLYGEWLRRENRRTDAREQLHRAHEMLTGIGAEAFTERARRELLATGKTVRSRTGETDRELTSQEAQIAIRARDGKTNGEIGAELFLSPRTVEWHLRKVFGKLGITSRRQLRQVLPRASRNR
ncbi:MAG TPA: AAA family ATPase [Streptosporangiaceae bacterium]|jgi:DNA-binding CsgD family transcriptional regulator